MKFKATLLLPFSLIVLSACSSGDDSNQQSDTGSTTGETNEPPNDANDSVLNIENVNAVIMQAFDVLTGRAYDRRLSAYPYVKRAPTLTPEYNALGSHFYYDTLACDNNGEKSENIFETGTGFDEITVYDTTYSNCSVASEILNGHAVLSGDICCDNTYSKEFGNNFSVDFGNNGKMDLSGIYKNDHYVSVDNFNYQFSYSGGLLLIENATTSRTENSLTGSFSMSPPVLENQTVYVAIDDAFKNDVATSNLAYSRGSLRIVADDSDILLVADNGDAETVTVTVNTGGQSTTLTEPWSNWFNALSFVPPTLGQEFTVASANGDGTVLNQQSYQAILAEVFAVATGERFGTTIFDLPGFPYPEFPYEDVRDIYGFGTEINQICDNGGSAELRPFRWGYNQVTTGWRSEFANCTRANQTYEGSFSTRDYGNLVYFSSGITVSEDSSSAFKGRVSYKWTADRADGPRPIYHYILKNLYLDSTSGSDLYVLSEANVNFQTQAKPFELESGSYSYMSGSFSLSSLATQQNTITVLFADRLRFDYSDSDPNTSTVSSEQGVLYINAGNGNELFLNASSGDPDTFTVRIYQPDQAAVTLTGQWQDWQSLLQFRTDLAQR